MRKSTVIGAAIGLFGALIFSTTTVQASNIGEEGCTPGYWKNHTENWLERPGDLIPSDMLLTAMYQDNEGGVLRPGFAVTAPLAGDTFLEALSYKGGPGAAGAERILMRAAVAAWLNAAHEGLGYPERRWTEPGNIVGSVNDAIASGDRATMLALATHLDDQNNLGCPL